MDYKRDFNAFCGAADITLCGLPHAEGAKYVPPTAVVTVFALEKGFAGSELEYKTSVGSSNSTPTQMETKNEWGNTSWDDGGKFFNN
ncbi:MAG: hypothetical protein J6S82_02885 [Bacteroidales bacterium]|nr:hypothetical protein [Bacteroidales bacterium]